MMFFGMFLEIMKLIKIHQILQFVQENQLCINLKMLCIIFIEFLQSKPKLFEFQNSEIKKLSDFELKLFSKRSEVKNYNRVVLSDKISNFFRQNSVDSDQDKIIFFSKVLSIPKIKDHHLTELLSIDQPTLLSVSDDLKSKWHKLYTLSDLSYKSLDDLNHIYESLTDSQWDEIFKNFNFSYSC